MIAESHLCVGHAYYILTFLNAWWASRAIFDWKCAPILVILEMKEKIVFALRVLLDPRSSVGIVHAPQNAKNTILMTGRFARRDVGMREMSVARDKSVV